MNAKDFGSFVINFIKNHPEIKDNLSSYVFYLDNAKIHKAKCLVHIEENINRFFGPPYSPELNPIERVFGEMIKFMRSKSVITEEELLNSILEWSKTITENQIRSFCGESLNYWKMALRKERF